MQIFRILMPIIGLLILLSPPLAHAETTESTTLSFSIKPDLTAESPEIIILEPDLQNDQFTLELKSEPNATIEVRSNQALTFTLTTNSEGTVQTTIPLQSHSSTIELVTIDYWGNISEPTTLNADLTEDLAIFSHQNQELTFTNEQSTTEKPIPQKEKTYSITHIPRNNSFTLTESDLTQDSDEDHLVDAYEIIEGQDPHTPTDLFQNTIDLINLDEAIIAHDQFFTYGHAPEGEHLRIFLESETGTRHLLWEDTIDDSGSFIVHTPFSEKGIFNIIIQNLDDAENIKTEHNKGTVTFNAGTDPLPLSVEAFYKVHSPIMQTSIFNLNDYAALGTTTLFGPNIDLTFKGTTDPLSKVFILWKGEAEWYLQALAHPESGTFELKAPETIPNGDYTTYIYSQDLHTNLLSDVVEARFNVTTAKKEGFPNHPSLNSIVYFCLLILYTLAIITVSLSIYRHLKRIKA